MAEYKGYNIEMDGTFGMYNVKTIGKGGGLPDCLQGVFTKPFMAQRAIDAYLVVKAEVDARPPPIQKVKLTPRG